MTRGRDRWRVGAGGAILATLLVLGAGAGLLSPHGPDDLHPDRRLESWSAEFPCGTDALGRCVLSRTLHGARVSLLLALAIVATQAAIGAAAGTLAGYRGGTVDLGLTALLDLLGALPEMLVALVAVGLVGASPLGVLVVLVVLGWGGLARVARSVALRERERTYVLAEVALGFPRARILLRTILPAVVRATAVLLPLKLGRVLMAVAGLGFLGLGFLPHTPEWGSMIAEGRGLVRSAPWVVLGPGAAIVLVTWGAAVLTAGLRSLAGPEGGAVA